MRRIWLSVVILGSLVTTARANVIVSNASFETPDLGNGPGSSVYNPTLAEQGGTGWAFLVFSGIAATGSGFNPPQPPHGDQVGVLEQFFSSGDTLTSFGQAIDGFTAGSYLVSFYASRRAGFDVNPFVVTIDGTPITFTGSTIVIPSTTSFQLFTSDPVALSAGIHTLAFTSLAPTTGDLNTFLDAVSITLVPEPSSLAMLGTGLGLGVIVKLTGWCVRLRRGTLRPLVRAE